MHINIIIILVFFLDVYGIYSVIYSHNKYAYIHIYMFMPDTYWRNKLIRRTQEDAGRRL